MSYPYFVPQDGTFPLTEKTAINHIMRYAPHRARHLFDFHVSPETHSSYNDMIGGLINHYGAPTPELSASLAFQVTMWCTGSQMELGTDSPVFDYIAAIPQTGDRYFDLIDLAIAQSRDLPEDAGDVLLGPHPPFVTVTLFANFNVNKQTTFPSSSLGPSLIHVSSSYYPKDPDFTWDNQGPIAICRTVLSQTQVSGLGDSNNIFDILTRQNGNTDEDALLYFNLRIRQPNDGKDSDGTPDFVYPSYADQKLSTMIDIICYNKNGRVNLGNLYIDSLRYELSGQPLQNTMEVTNVNLSYKAREVQGNSSFFHIEQMLDTDNEMGGNELAITPDTDSRIAILDTNQRSHVGLGVSYDQLNKLSINLVSMRHMHRYGFLGPVRRNAEFKYGNYKNLSYTNDFRKFNKSIEKRSEYNSNINYQSMVTSSLFMFIPYLEWNFSTGLDVDDTQELVMPFYAMSYMPSALLGISFNTGLDKYDTYDASDNRDNDLAVGLLSEGDIRDGFTSFDSATGLPYNNSALIPEINQRYMGTFDQDCSEFFTCVVETPLSSSYGNENDISTNRYFDDRYNVLVSNDTVSKVRPDLGPDAFFGLSYTFVDSGKANIEVELASETTYNFRTSGIFNITMGMEGSVYPFQFLNTREIPKPLHMDHVGRNDPDSGFDVG
jgi:hypothetical protein